MSVPGLGDFESNDFCWQEIGDRIRDWRLARGWSQQKLAETSGMSQSGIVHLEKGDTNPQLSTLREVAHAFDKGLRELIFGIQPEHSSEYSEFSARTHRVLGSNDEAAVSALQYGLKMAELLLERRSGRSDRGMNAERPGAKQTRPAPNEHGKTTRRQPTGRVSRRD